MKKVLSWNDRIDFECSNCNGYLIRKVLKPDKWIKR